MAASQVAAASSEYSTSSVAEHFAQFQRLKEVTCGDLRTFYLLQNCSLVFKFKYPDSILVH